MKLTSPAFSQGETIPSKYTCEGENNNPPLTISDVPTGSQSLTLIMDDPDVPAYIRPDKMYDHWVIYNIPPDTHKIQEMAKPPGIEGKNTEGNASYTGPCPPDREHRYFFKLYALDKKLDLPRGATKKQVEEAMQGHVITKTELIGRYEKVNT